MLAKSKAGVRDALRWIAGLGKGDCVEQNSGSLVACFVS